MTINSFPPLSLDSWRATRDTLAGYSKVVGKIRRALHAALKSLKSWGKIGPGVVVNSSTRVSVLDNVTVTTKEKTP